MLYTFMTSYVITCVTPVEHQLPIDPKIPSFSALEHLEPCSIQVTVDPTSGTNSEATNVGDINTNAASATPLPAITGTAATDFITDKQ